MNPCRFCGGITDLLVPITKGEGVELELETKVARHLPIHVSSNDGLPQGVCYPCVDLLLTWDAFATVCIDMDAKLRSVAKEIDATSESLTQQEGSFSESDDEPLASQTKRIKPENTEGATHTMTADNNLEVNFTELKPVTKDSDKIVCNTCFKVFKNKTYLAKHALNCGRKEELTCEICFCIYKSKANLKRHKEREHFKNQEECPVCKLSICQKKLRGHLRTVHSIFPQRDRKFKCKLCDQWFVNVYTKNEHLKKIHNHETVKCNFCEFEGFRNVVKRHMRTVHSTKQFPCSQCSTVCKTVHLLRAHMTTHSDLRSYICDICGMSFKRLANVRDHMKCHQQKSNQCQICGNFFARKRYLAIHEKTIHNLYPDGTVPEQKGFECVTCGAKLKWKKNLQAHMRIHTGEKPYVCKICKKDFTCHGALRSHMSKHTPIDFFNLDQNAETITVGSITAQYDPPTVKNWHSPQSVQSEISLSEGKNSLKNLILPHAKT